MFDQKQVADRSKFSGGREAAEICMSLEFALMK